jgi:hypothetical protein
MIGALHPRRVWIDSKSNADVSSARAATSDDSFGARQASQKQTANFPHRPTAIAPYPDEQ